MAIDTAIFDFLPYTREFDDLGNLYYIERLVIEANTGGEVVTPSIEFSGTSVNLSTFSSTSRTFSEVAVDRLGPLANISFTPINLIEWYGVEMFIRPVELGVQLVHTGGGPTRNPHTFFPGRTSDRTTSISFDINPFALAPDARHVNPILRYMWIDIVTGAEEVTPVLVDQQGAETQLTAIVAASRGIQEFSLLGTKRVRTIRLDGDFSSSSVVLYDIECDMYIPNSRRIVVG